MSAPSGDVFRDLVCWVADEQGEDCVDLLFELLHKSRRECSGTYTGKPEAVRVYGVIGSAIDHITALSEMTMGDRSGVWTHKLVVIENPISGPYNDVSCVFSTHPFVAQCYLAWEAECWDRDEPDA